MRQDVEFDAAGVVLRGWHYVPDGATGPVPTIVMAHGFSAVKEMYLDDYAEHFSGAGLQVLVFDHRNFGEWRGLRFGFALAAACNKGNKREHQRQPRAFEITIRMYGHGTLDF